MLQGMISVFLITLILGGCGGAGINGKGNLKQEISPTPTPTLVPNPTASPTPMVLPIDLIDSADEAVWENNDGHNVWENADPYRALGESRVYGSPKVLQDGSTYSPTLFVHPKWVSNGVTRGVYSLNLPDQPLGLTAQAGFGKDDCSNGAYVSFLVFDEEFKRWNSLTQRHLLKPLEQTNLALNEIRADLKDFRGKEIKLQVLVEAGPDANCDHVYFSKIKIQAINPLSLIDSAPGLFWSDWYGNPSWDRYWTIAKQTFESSPYSTHIETNVKGADGVVYPNVLVMTPSMVDDGIMSGSITVDVPAGDPKIVAKGVLRFQSTCVAVWLDIMKYTGGKFVSILSNGPLKLRQTAGTIPVDHPDVLVSLASEAGKKTSFYIKITQFGTSRCDVLWPHFEIK